uniref:Bromo domain-containing protein n=1 Tax=Caenorhabditis tropicalis TaxID=1561998 RepID=A0A1I7TR72_9PELO
MMEELVEMIKKLKLEFDKEQQWNRYVDGDILYDVTDEKSANTIHSYVLDPENNLSLEERHKYFEYIMQALTNLSIDSIDKTDGTWLETAAKNREIFCDAKETILKRWSCLIFEKCGAENNKNDMFFQLENLTLSFWRASAERKEYLYQYVEPEEDPEPYDEEVPDIFVENKKTTKKKLKKKSSKKGLTNTIELALKSGEKRKKKHLSQKTLLSRSPSLKRGEHIRFNLYSDVTPIWKKSTLKERATDGTEHKIDFGTEAFLGPIYHISSFESGKTSQKYGTWSITLGSR